MHSFLIVIGAILIGAALRSCRTRIFRKLGALTYLAASGLAFYYLSDSLIIAAFGVLIWFFIPLLELFTRVRHLRLPLNNKLHQCYPPNEDQFPNADASIAALDEEGFEYIGHAGWEWAGASQCYQFFWHPEERCVAAVCFCKQSKITFSFVTITSRDAQGQLWRTTNYPFSQPLKESPNVWQNHLPCSCAPIVSMLASHHYFISLHGAMLEDLIIPDPDQVEQEVENDMRRQIEHNINQGIIKLAEDNDQHFKYSFRGLMFLWKQLIKDMIRLA